MSDLFEILACELKKNNVSVEIHRVASPNLLAIGENIVGEKIILDFSKHDKVFEDKISELKAKIAIKDMDYKTASELLGKYQQENESLKQRIAELESKETEKPTKINLNDWIKVKLTPLGAEIYYHQCDEVNKRIRENGGTELEPIMPRIDKDGYTEFQLWYFMELYGEHIGMCKPNVISPLDIIIVE